MAANSLEYAKIFMQALDKVMLQMLTSAPMELNSNLIKYNGGNEVKISSIAMQGLADYDRATGFTSGSVSTTFQTHTLSQDRGREFSLDAMDVDETNFVATAGNVMGEFQRTKVVPEIDAYRYSTIFGYANTALKTARYTPDDATIFDQLDSDIANLQNVVGEDSDMTIYMSYEASHKLNLADKLIKRLDVGTFADGSINTKIKVLDGIPIVRVPSARFKSAFTFGSDGYTAPDTAMGINWIIAVNRSLIAVNKQEKLRVFTPDVNQDADAWKMQYRRYHDLFVTDNGVAGIYVSYTAIEAPALTATVAAGTSAGTKFTATASDGTTLGYILGTVSPEVKFNDIYSGDVYTSGADIDDAVATNILTMLEVDATGHITKVKEVTLEAADIFA